jgi:hypothetical protein
VIGATTWSTRTLTDDIQRLGNQAEVVTSRPPAEIPDSATSRCFSAEVTLRVRAGSDLAWIRRSLDAAERRLLAISPATEIVSAVYVPEDGRLICIVEAASREDVLRLFEIALLPSARVLDVVVVELPPRARTPG